METQSLCTISVPILQKIFQAMIEAGLNPTTDINMMLYSSIIFSLHSRVESVNNHKDVIAHRIVTWPRELKDEEGLTYLFLAFFISCKRIPECRHRLFFRDWICDVHEDEIRIHS